MNVADELEKLQQLHQSGGISDEEFAKAKDRLLTSPAGGLASSSKWSKPGAWSGCKRLKTWWPGTESNRRRQPFQGCALPAELPGRGSFSVATRRRLPQRL